MKPTTRPFALRCMRALALFAAVASTYACASDRNHAEEFRKQLGGAYARLEEGQLQEAERAAMDMLGASAALSDDAGDFRLQRLYALWIVTQANATAAVGEGYLDVPERVADAGRKERVREIRSVGHLVAATLYASYTADRSRGLGNAPRVHDGTELLPERVRDLGVEDVRHATTLTHIAVSARLGLQGQVNASIADAPREWLRYQDLDAQMERSRVPAALRAWVHYGFFRRATKRPADHDAAFRFGVRALEISEETGASLPVRVRDRIEDWYLGVGNDVASLEFVHPVDETPPKRGELFDVENRSIRLLDYKGRPR